MDSLEKIPENTKMDIGEEQDDDLVELPPDTLAILNEFLQNKDNQKSLESEDVFEEDWVHEWSIFFH